MQNNKVENGDTVSVHYRGTLDDGTEFDSSHTRGETMTFQVGEGQLISGFDAAVPGMTTGEVKNISLTPEEAYGPVIEDAVQVVEKTQFPPDFPFEVGVTVSGYGANGAPMAATIQNLEESTVTLDMNHPMAGKNLNFEIELVSIQ
jgi:FKBP-type peptidyl-prolyl cis-trans isomerase 2